MNKKPGLLSAVLVLALIVLATMFDLHLGGDTVVKLSDKINPDTVLYICPIKDGVWDTFSETLKFLGTRYLFMAFVFAFIVLCFSWAWALYQNLVKDKFSADAYKTPWDMTKVFFWVAVVCYILVMTPNYFRSVSVHSRRDSGKEWVLCEKTSADARAVPAGAFGLK